MRWRDIIYEAPLADFATFGDPDREGSFRSDDLRAMRSPKWREKVFKAFRKTPYEFNVYVYNGPEGVAPVGRGHGFINDPIQVNNLANLGKYVGIQPLRAIEHLIGKTPPDASTSITVLLVENEGNERMALTPWILAHRVAHALVYAGQASSPSPNPAIRTQLDVLFSNASSLMRAMERLAGIGRQYGPELERLNAVAQLIGTFRSARMGKLASVGEFAIEMITQYLTAGAVTFNRPDLADGLGEQRRTPVGPDDGTPYARPTQAVIDETVTRYENRFNTIFAALLNVCVGKAFVL